MSRLNVRLLVLSLIVLTGIADAASRPPVTGHGGAVVSAEAESTAVGLEILRQGGNAADAAVATALAMVVVHPEAGNLGGGGFAVVEFGETTASLDFREKAPAAAHRDMYLDNEGNPIEGASFIGPLASGVPGSPAGLHELHRKFGQLPWAKVVAPASRLASEGFTVTSRLVTSLDGKRDRLERFPESAAVWMPGGKLPEAGSTMQLPDLARTLQLYAQHGPLGIYTGPVAKAVVDASEKHGGILTAGDLAGYRAEWRPPVEFEALGWRFLGMDLPSSGGYLVGAALQTIEKLDWRTHPRFGANRRHLMAETWRRIFADRAHLGDPGSTKVRPRELMASERISELAAGIDPAQVTNSTLVRGWPEATPREPDDTVHLSVIDRDGNIVALTTTLNGLFGCGLWVEGAGFFLNNEMDDFATAPGRPNHFGLVQGTANEVAPGRRMLSSMSPTIARRGKEAVALGGRGGSRIPTAVTQVLLNLLVDGDGLRAAIDRPRIHHQWFPDEILAEADALSPETRAALEELGHEINIDSERNAKVNAVRLLADGRFEAAGDSRGPSAGGVVEPIP
jgi:gamma-glutamyltranspeptidase/glutathione hydrolase